MKISFAWLKKNRLEAVIIGLIILTAFLLRVYRINEYMTFLGDEGRDGLVVKDILVNHHFPLLGPPTSVGNMYLGPLYYYMMALSMTVSWLNPIAAAVMVAVIGTASVGLIYYLAREWFGFLPAATSSLLYGLSPVNIVYSRSSWNPNPAPFFSLLGILGLYNFYKSHDTRWLILTGASLAFAVQMHYLALILAPIFGLLWLRELAQKVRGEEKYKHFWMGTVLAVLAFLVLMSPVAIFDFRHNFMNFRAVSAFFLEDRSTTVNLNIFNTLGRIWPVYANNLIGRYLTGENVGLVWLVSILLIEPLGWVIFRRIRYKEKFKWPYLALGVWLVIGILGLSLYKQTIYDHYLGFLNPVVYLLLAALLGLVLSLKANFRLIVVGLSMVLIVCLVVVNLMRSPLLNPPNKQLQRTQAIANFLIDKAAGRPFNFALIAEHNYDAAYQFYLDLYGHKPKQLPFDITDQLFVVCEDAICSPVGHPKYEIAAFGWTRIDYEQTVEGVKVFRLVHNTPIAQK